MTKTEQAVNLVERLFNVSTILIISACISALGTGINIVRAALGAKMHFGYVSLLAVICVTSIVTLWLARRGNEKDAFTAYAWIAGSAFAGMVLIDCYRGEAWEHLYWLFLFGISSLVFLVSIERALSFSAACVVLSLAVGLIRKSPSSTIGLALLPVATWALMSFFKTETIKLIAEISGLKEAQRCMKVYLDGRREARRA